MAQLLSATWRETRHAVLETGMVPQFQFRQFLFACQARILVKINRHIEVHHTSRQTAGPFAPLIRQCVSVLCSEVIKRYAIAIFGCGVRKESLLAETTWVLLFSDTTMTWTG